MSCLALSALPAETRLQNVDPIPRIYAITRELDRVDTEQGVLTLATEAARLAGFAIWTEDRKPVAPSLNSEPLKLAVTESELKAFSSMYHNGQSVKLGDLVSGLDGFYQGGSGATCGPKLVEWLNMAAIDSRPSVRALGALLDGLNTQAKTPGLAGPFTLETRLDPLQTLFILRVVTEEMVLPVRKAKAQILFAQLSPWSYAGHIRPFQDAPPGFAEDAFVGGITGLIGTTLENLGGKWDKYGKGAGYTGMVVSLVKMVSTYVTLKGEATIEAPGNPLVRTMDTSAGDQRTIKMRFYFDGTKIQDWLKENRKWLMATGVDFDMPKSGALAGVETGWEIMQSRKYASKQLIQLVRGSGDISKVKTDADGVAKITVEGKPQPKALDKKKARPVMKKVVIQATPQVKGTEMGQDLTDAVFGAIGIKSGPIGLLGPVMECMYRMKWSGTQSVALGIKDWESGENVAEVTLIVEGSGTESTKYNTRTYTINRTLSYTDVQAEIEGMIEAPKIDPQVLKQLPPEMRKQMEDAMKQANKAAEKYSFRGEGPGVLSWNVSDLERFSGEPDGCDNDLVNESASVTGSEYKQFATTEPGDAPFRIMMDAKALKAKILLPKVLDVLRVVETRSKKNGNQPNVRRMQNSMPILHGISLEGEDSPNQLTLPLSIKESPTETVYTGTRSIPFKFGPQEKFSGRVIVEYTVRWSKSKDGK